MQNVSLSAFSQTFASHFSVIIALRNLVLHPLKFPLWRRHSLPFENNNQLSPSPPPTSLVETPFKDFDQLNSHNHLQTAGGNLHSKGFQEVFRIISPGLKNMENSSYFHHMVKMHNSSFALMVVLQCSLSSLD